MSLLLLAFATGLVWAFVTPAATLTVTGDGGLTDDFESQSARLFAAPGIFALAAAVFGVLCAVVVWFALPAVRGLGSLLYTLLAAVIGSAIAMDFGGWLAGRRFGAVDPEVAGVYQVVGRLWMPDAWWGPISVPWLLLACAPGFAALVYLLFFTGATPAEDGPADPDAPAEPAVAPPPGWTYTGAPAAQAPAEPGADDVTAGDEEWRTRR